MTEQNRNRHRTQHNTTQQERDRTEQERTEVDRTAQNRVGTEIQYSRIINPDSSIQKKKIMAHGKER